MELETKFVTVNGHRIRYIEAGSGAPLVMLHGLGFNASADQWRPIIAELAADFRCIALDQVGWGWSDRPVEGYSFPLLVSILEGLVDSLGIDHAVFVGHTLGGWTSTLVALDRPELVDKLVLFNTAGLNAIAPRAAGSFTKLLNRDETRQALENTFSGSLPVTDEMVDDELARHERDGVLESYSAILQFVNDPDIRKEWSLEPRLPKVNCPILVVWGADDHILGSELGARAVELAPNARLLLIEDGAHAPFARKPAESAEAVREFIKSS